MYIIIGTMMGTLYSSTVIKVNIVSSKALTTAHPQLRSQGPMSSPKKNPTKNPSAAKFTRCG